MPHSCHYCFSPHLDARLQALMDRHTEGQLSAAEREELEALVALSETISLLQETPTNANPPPDLANALPALRRAALKAKEQARAAGLKIPVYREGKIIEEWPGGEKSCTSPPMPG